QKKHPSFFFYAINDWWETKLCGALCLVRNDAQNDADSSPLLKDIGAKTTQPANPVCNVYFRNFFEPLLLAVRHHGKCHVESVFRLESRCVSNRMEFATYAHDWKRAYLKV